MKIKNMMLNDNVIPVEKVLALARGGQISGLRLRFTGPTHENPNRCYYEISFETDEDVVINGFNLKG